LQLKIILFSLLLGCAASDIGGFIFGKLFKGPKLTKISPNKTIAGSIGSLIFTIFTIVGSIFYFTETFDYIFCFIGLITSLACQLGDLFF
jgi:phosphatidate cytidylyltransferase